MFATRLLRLVRELYSGPFKRQVKEGPDSPLADQLVAIWICGAASRRYRWPKSFFAVLADWLCRPSYVFGDPQLGLSRAMALIYELRKDIQSAFDINATEGCLAFASWFINHGAFEYEFGAELIPPAFLNFLRTPDRRGSKLTRFHRLVWQRRTDLQRRFPLDDAQGEDAYMEWSAGAGLQDRVVGFWSPLVFPASRRAPAGRTEPICLTGLWNSASGRGEDLRMTAAVLRHLGRSFVIFDTATCEFLEFHRHEGGRFARRHPGQPRASQRRHGACRLRQVQPRRSQPRLHDRILGVGTGPPARGAARLLFLL